MAVEVGAPPEGFPTLPALVRLLSGVDSLMGEKEGMIAEGFPTLATFVGLLLSVAVLGNLEHTVLTRRWSTLSFSFHVMLLLMNNEGRPVGKGFPTVATLVGFLPGVNSLVIYKGCLSSKSFPTLLTGECFLPSGCVLRFPVVLLP